MTKATFMGFTVKIVLQEKIENIFWDNSPSNLGRFLNFFQHEIYFGSTEDNLESHASHIIRF